MNIQAGTTSDNVTVLIVDDDEVDVMGVRRAFVKSGLDNPLVVVENGQAALDKLREDEVAKPYLVLLDLNMPRMGGIEFLCEARKDARLHKAIVFVFTTSKAEEDKCRAYQHNVAGYIVKDRSAGGFINAVELLHKYARNVEFPP
ncbi:MAG TPA: response regulator [Patescibacteria group bacterium]|nr:response regulator [Patescibacteria group bacterium]